MSLKLRGKKSLKLLRKLIARLGEIRLAKEDLVSDICTSSDPSKQTEELKEFAKGLNFIHINFHKDRVISAVFREMKDIVCQTCGFEVEEDVSARSAEKALLPAYE